MKKTLASDACGLKIRGIIAIIIGLVAIFWPGLSLEIIVVLFAAFALLDGVVGVMVAITSAKQNLKWWPFLLEGILGLVIGLLVLAWPGVTLVILIYLVAVWAIVTGLFELVAAFTVDWVPGAKWFLGLAGVFSVILAIVLFTYPIAGIEIMIWLIGIYAVAFGIVLLVSGFRLKHEAKKIKE